MWLYRADQVSLFFGGFFHVPRVVDTLTSLSTDFVRKKFHEKWVIWASEVVKIWIFRPQPKIFFCCLKNTKTVKMVKKIENFFFFHFFGQFLPVWEPFWVPNIPQSWDFRPQPNFLLCFLKYSKTCKIIKKMKNKYFFCFLGLFLSVLAPFWVHKILQRWDL